MKKISAVHGRAEELARQKGYREQFDLCVSRAVANLSTLSEYCLPFVKVGGKFISYKANEVEEETKQAEHALEVLGGACVDIQKFQLPDSEMNRAFVIIEKKKGHLQLIQEKQEHHRRNLYDNENNKIRIPTLKVRIDLTIRGRYF